MSTSELFSSFDASISDDDVFTTDEDDISSLKSGRSLSDDFTYDVEDNNKGESLLEIMATSVLQLQNCVKSRNLQIKELSRKNKELESRIEELNKKEQENRNNNYSLSKSSQKTESLCCNRNSSFKNLIIASVSISLAVFFGFYVNQR